MKFIISLAAAAAALTASPALADKGGNGHGNGHGNGNGHGDRYESRDNDDDQSRGRRWSHHAEEQGCPPGLARKHNGCLPPGQARKMWRQGQRVPYGYRSWTPYNQIPRRYVDQYGLNPDSRYVYQDGYLYQVNPRTMLVQQVLSALLR